MGRRMAKGFISRWMGRCIAEDEKTISNMDSGLKHGRTSLDTKENDWMGRSKGKGYLNEPLDRCTKETLKRIKFKDMGSTRDKMGRSSLESGETAR